LGVTSLLIVFIVAGLVLLVGWATFSPIIFGLFDDVTGFYTATQLQPRITGGETICDLRIKVFADLTQDFGIGSPEITIDRNNAFDFDFFECFSSSEVNSLELIDFDKRINFVQQSFISFGGEVIHAEIVLRDANDPTQKVDAFTQSQLRRAIEIPAGLIPTPFNMDVEFVVTNIPLRDYNLEIFYGRPINNMDVGEPFLATISGNR